jgi:hypothetical protein
MRVLPASALLLFKQFRVVFTTVGQDFAHQVCEPCVPDAKELDERAAGEAEA